MKSGCEQQRLIIGWLIVNFNMDANRRYLRELALAISFASLGSSHTFRLPHFKTLAASRFCNLRVLKKKVGGKLSARMLEMLRNNKIAQKTQHICKTQRAWPASFKVNNGG